MSFLRSLRTAVDFRFSRSGKSTGIILATSGATVAKVSGDAIGLAAPVDKSMKRKLQALAPLGMGRADVIYQVGQRIIHAKSPIDLPTREPRTGCPD